ncbi:hypothetical protein QQS21_003136 [Conoideocrella luteorostrata]|uniref:ATP-grasp domain-containing protein n=1 Tax=Conoideocrella luteorostrata TaxID=1105319 RepID=A0AAJ0CUR3_9HYPO|nr:hypothetical protein QQS21_003136 [Conoideocrella luteorostrata]
MSSDLREEEKQKKKHPVPNPQQQSTKMRICVLQSSYEGSGCTLEGLDDVPSQPGAFTTQHTFEYRFIHPDKNKAKQEIDEAAAEGFDFYFNFLWGTLDDPVAGLQESRYFESLGLPSCGVRSWERSQTKNDFYRNARHHGRPLVPGNKTFPLFVKPANGCASQMIHDKSVCHDQMELESALRCINEALHDNRVRRAQALGIQDTEAYANSYDPIGRDSDDIVVQEFIEGTDYTCSVIQLGSSCVALTPFVYKMKVQGKDKFLTFDLKFDASTQIELLVKRDNPDLFERLQQAAIEAFLISGCNGSHMGCDVDLRATPNGQVFAIEINPQPAAFMPEGTFQDLPIIHSLPGRHPAVINIFIANHMITHPDKWSVSLKVAAEYDNMAPKYDKGIETLSTIATGIRKLVDDFDFSGTVIDLACGTGIFGRVLRESKGASQTPLRGSSRLLGCDISAGMLEICSQAGFYDDVHMDSMETFLLSPDRYANSVDHIVCFSAIHFLRPELFSFILVLCFIVANKSITLSVDEIPDEFNEVVTKKGLGHMHSTNHLSSMKAFGEPKGWHLVRSERQFSWKSPHTGVEVYTTYFRFERADDRYRDLMFMPENLPN